MSRSPAARNAASQRLSVRSFGGSLFFDGADDYINIAQTTLQAESAKTICFWIKFSAVETAQMFASFNNNTTTYENFTLQTTKLLRVELAGVAGGMRYTGSTRIIPNKWYFVCYTHRAFDKTAARVAGDVTRININGVDETVTTAAIGGSTPAVTKLTVGVVGPGTLTNDFGGMIADYIVYDRELSLDEIKGIYYKNNIPSSPFLRWKLNEGTGSTANDSSSNGNTGSVTGATFISDSPFTTRTNITNTLLKDTFSDVDGTAISSHTPSIAPTNSAWSQTDPTSFYVQGNMIQPNRYTHGDIATINIGISNFTIQSIVIPYNSGANRGDPGLIFRYVDANNYWYCYPESDGPVFQIYKVVGGVATLQLLMKWPQMASGIPLTIRVDCMGDNITLWLDGQEITTIVDSTNKTGTNVGLYLRKSNSPTGKPSWDSFQAYQFKGTYIEWPHFIELAASSPIVALGTTGAWDDVDINDPSVAYDSANSRYVMAYTGYHASNIQKLGFAYATSLTGTWTKEAANPVLDADVGDTFNMNGCLVKFGNTWYYYYGAGAGGIKINCATSSDLLTWTKQGTVLQGAGGTAWDASSTFDVFARVTQDGTTVQLWYVGKNGSTVGGLGLATSTDGLTFTRDSRNPVLGIPLPSYGNFGEPDVYVPTGKEGQIYLVTFDGSNYNLSGSNATRYLVQAITFDNMRTWHLRHIALTASGSGWMNTQVFDPCVVVDGETMYLLHAGSNTTGAALNLSSQIGIASSLTLKVPQSL